MERLSAAHRLGIKEGSTLIAVNGDRTTDKPSARKLLAAAKQEEVDGQIRVKLTLSTEEEDDESVSQADGLVTRVTFQRAKGRINRLKKDLDTTQVGENTADAW